MAGFGNNPARHVFPGKTGGKQIARTALLTSTFLRRPACENRSVTKYAVVIHEEPQGGYWAEVPALPGCYSQGDSVDDLMANVREAISGVLAVMCEEGTQPESNIQILDIAV